MSWKKTIETFLIIGVISVVGNTLGYHFSLFDALIGYGFILFIILLGKFVAQHAPFKLPVIFWISIIGVLVTCPLSPIGTLITQYTSKIEFLALCTPILAYSGLSVGKDLELFKKLSWRIVVVALTVFTGTFLFSTMIAQVVLTATGAI